MVAGFADYRAKVVNSKENLNGRPMERATG
jgi:hypothetical protein